MRPRRPKSGSVQQFVSQRMIHAKHTRWDHGSDGDLSQTEEITDETIQREELEPCQQSEPFPDSKCQPMSSLDKRHARQRHREAQKLVQTLSQYPGPALSSAHFPKKVDPEIVKRFVGERLTSENPDSLWQRPLRPTSRLEMLPLELLRIIISTLPICAQACLAFSSRTLFHLLRETTFPVLWTRAKNDINKLLGRESADQNYCETCRKLHSPFLSIAPASSAVLEDVEVSSPQSSSAYNVSLPCKRQRIHSYTTFHKRLPDNMIGTILKQSRLGYDPTPLLQQVQETRTCFVKGTCWKNSIIMQRHEGSRIINNRLFTKAHVVFYPAAGYWEDQTVIQSLLEAINTMRDQICHHRTWAGELRRFWGLGSRKMDARELIKGLKSGALSYDEAGLPLECWVSHPESCPTHRTSCTGKIPLGCAMKCRPAYCRTNFSFNVASFDSLPARVLVFTTWKELGTGPPRLEEDGSWYDEWQGPKEIIMKDAAASSWRARADGRTPQRGGFFFRTFEEVDDEDWDFEGPMHVYRPRIRPLDLIRLREFADRSRCEEAGRFGRPHRPDENGIIQYPDPYESKAASQLK